MNVAGYMAAMRTTTQVLLQDSIVHRRDIPTIIACLKNGATMNEFILHNAHSDFDMLQAIISHCPDVIHIKNGLILTVLRVDYKNNRDKIRYILENCKVSMNAGLSSVMLDAVRGGDQDMVEYLCNNWEIALITPLVVAAKECQYDIMKFIFNKGTFNSNTLNIALCDTIFTNVECLGKTQQLKNVVSFLLKNGATTSAPLLKMCAYKSITLKDFTILTTLMCFHDLKDIMHNIEVYASHTTSIEQWTSCVVDAFNMSRASRKIVKGFRVRRRLNLARCLFRNKAIYSPALVYTVISHSGL